MAETTQTNAFRAALEKVINEERAKLATSFSQIRIVGAALGVLAMGPALVRNFWGFLPSFEALVGNRVFRADSEMELMKQVLEAPIPAPSVLRPDVPPALDAVVMGLLERGLERRTASANELRRQLLALPRELLDVSNGRKVLASFVDKAREWAASRPAEATATAVSQSGTDATSTSTVAVKSE